MSAPEHDAPADAVAVARRYRRLERPVSVGVAVLVAALVVGAVLVLPPLLGVLVAFSVLLLARAPVVRSEGRTRLSTDADLATVRADFEGPTPPVLAFQWGVADAVAATDGGATYDVSYLFGLRSTPMAIETDVTTSEDGGVEVSIGVTAAGDAWGTYRASIRERDGETVVDVEWASDRRFGLRRVPQWLVAERYRDAALEAQGYVVEERDASLTV